MPHQQNEQIRVFAALIADLFHYGHVNFLREARRLGNHLTVGLISDRRAQGYKRKPILSFAERYEVIKACRYVDEIMELDENVTNDFMRRHNFRIRAYGVANKEEEERNFRTLWKDMDRAYFHRLDYTDGISSSGIIDRIRSRSDL